MSGRRLEVFTPEQTKNMIPDWARDINGIGANINRYVKRHVKKPGRRGGLRNIAIVGCGGRGAFEIAAVVGALGPALVTVTDITKGDIVGAKTFWDAIVEDFRERIPANVSNSTLKYEQDDLFHTRPELGLHNLDAAFAFGIYPTVVTNGGTDNVIDMVREDGGIAVFTKKSLGGNVSELRAHLKRRAANGKGDIKILFDEELVRGPWGSYNDDQHIFVVKRVKR